MNRLEKTLVSAAVLSSLFGVTRSANACTPPPPVVLNPVSAIEFKLPKGSPTTILSPTTRCPEQVWPFVFHGLTDAQIVQYLGTTPAPAPPAIAAWESARPYVAGSKASHSGKVYTARYWTQGDTPSASSVVWDEQADVFGNPPAWYATKAYPGGAKVTYGTNIYSAKWWTQGETPGVASDVWPLVGPANGRRPALFHVSAAYGNDHDATGNRILKLSWNTDWTSAAEAPLADHWKVMVNGVVVQQGTSIESAHSDCAPNTPSCVSLHAQKGAFSVYAIFKEQLTFWLCAGNSCRPSPRVTWWGWGVDGTHPTLP